MPSFDSTIEFEVLCSCGTGLCNQSKVKAVRNANVVIVEPCSDCLEKAKNEGRKEGYEEREREMVNEKGGM